MTLENRIEAFAALGRAIDEWNDTTWEEIYQRTAQHNNWFTPQSIQQAFDGIRLFLDPEKLSDWTKPYKLNPETPKTVAVIMAGNIPLVGFHDLLSVLISGHKLKAKLSSQDQYLPRLLLNKLQELEPAFAPFIEVTDEVLKNFEAVIATGSNNTSRYFDYYFGKYPHIIRKNRTSVAVLEGDESTETLEKLGEDIFTYYGLGCRNVSKLFVPENYDFSRFIEAQKPYQEILDHHKYANNYDYNKSVYLVNREPHLDSGFFLMRETKDLVSPISVIFYEQYENEATLEKRLSEHEAQLQCIVSAKRDFGPATVAVGQAQCPGLSDYADGVDTLQFLSNL